MAVIQRWGTPVIKYGIGLLALAWLLDQFTLNQVMSVMQRAEIRTFFVVILVSGVGLAGRFYTWHVLCNRFQGTSFMSSINTDLILSFVNQLLPSRLSGRAVAPFVVRSESGMGYPDAVAVAGVHTGLYAVLYGAVSLVGFSISYRQFSAPIVSVLFLSTVLYIAAGTLVLFAGNNLDTMDTFVERFVVIERLPVVGDRLSGLVEKFPSFSAPAANSFTELSSDVSVLLRYSMGWMVDKFAAGLRAWVLLIALGTSFESVILLSVYLVMAYSVTLLPLTPGGVGVTEAVATAVFVALGIPSAVVVSVVILDRFLGVYLPALLGWYPSVQTDFSALTTE
jgi:uncharacterized protein (TIRG00374 family)